MKKDIRLLGLDFDGTILDSQKEFPPETVQAIRELEARGVAVSTSTGRGLAELRDYSEEVRAFHYGILASGGLVYDFRKQEIIYKNCLDLELALAVIEAGRAEQAMVHVLTIHGSGVLQDDLADMGQFQMGIYQPMFERVALAVADVADFAREHATEINKVNLYHRSPESRERTRERLAALDMAAEDAETTSLEYAPKGISKAHGLRVLCQHLGVDIAKSAVIGDGPNDMEILQAAGFSIAMGNAAPEIRALADAVTLDNDHNGVVAAINKYFL